jgi:hypothetical protein
VAGLERSAPIVDRHRPEEEAMGALLGGSRKCGRGRLTRATAVVVGLAFSNACAVTHWHSEPTAFELARRFKLEGQTVRIPTTGSLVTLRVVRVAYPFVEGIPQPGSGEVTFPMGRATAEVRTKGPRGSRFVTLPPGAALAPENLVDRDVQFLTPGRGRLALHVLALEEGIVRGEPIACWGAASDGCTEPILVDLREAAWIDVRGTAWLGIVGNLAILGLLALVWAFFAALSHLDIE